MITVTVSEGVFVFRGSRPDGGCQWTFLANKGAPGRVPQRWKKYLKPKETSPHGA